MFASSKMQEYFKKLDEKVKEAYKIAEKARKKGLDPEDEVPIPLAKNMAERVEGLITSVAPQIKNSGVTERIVDLEKEHGTLSWKVALIIAKEVAEEKFCKFKDKREAIEVGIRTGFAYHTVGVVAAPLEGFVELKIKKRRDGKEYFSLFFSGPIRGAGGTAMGVALIIADYVRKELGYYEYDPDEKEMKRIVTEMYDYNDRVTNLQYKPSEEEILFITKHLPLEVNGDPTEKFEVSNYKDLDRIETNRIRGGMALVMSMVALKAPKLWKELSKWGSNLGLEHWNWLEKFLKLQKAAKAGKKIELTKDYEDFKITEKELIEETKKTNENKKEKKDETKEKESNEGKEEKLPRIRLTPDKSYISDLVSGRPVISHPLAFGGLRLRYGRGRTSGYSSASIHPATMILLDGFIAIGTQIKTERPGKAASVTSCDTIEAPIVKLKSGEVKRIKTVEEAKQIKDEVEQILFLGDILFSYGDFLDRAHPLVPVGITEEQYSEELKEKIEEEKYKKIFEELKEKDEELHESIKKILEQPLYYKPKVEEAIKISKIFSFYMHPEYSFYFSGIKPKELLETIKYLTSAKTEGELNKKLVLKKTIEKELLEKIGLPHKTTPDFIVVEHPYSTIILESLKEFFEEKEKIEEKISLLLKTIEEEKIIETIELVNKISKIQFKDKAGTFIGARMGRPEKAKMRKLTGSPHVLFPIGDEGGRLRSFQSALEKGYVNADFPEYYCKKCDKITIYRKCEVCGEKTELTEKIYSKRKIDIKYYFNDSLKTLKTKEFPNLIKGVRGTSNKTHIPEYLAKGILRAMNDVYVNKDGTIRYDMTELPITHFKPKEIGTSIEKLKELGYDKDIYGEELKDENQILELKPQDIILGASPDSPDEGADEILFRIGKFIDDELEKIYGLKKYYNFKNKKDTVGSIVIGLAPHTSAGIIGRVIGYSKSQAMLCHPLYHAAMRRDTDGDESCVIMLMDGLLNFSREYLPDKRGSRTMDAPLVLTSILDPSEVDDMVHKLDVAWNYGKEIYEKAEEYKMPWDVKIPVLGDYLGEERQYEKMGFTHNTNDINEGVTCSSYKLLPSMEEKLKGQMNLAYKIKAVDEDDVARLVIERHLVRDIKGNFRKFSQQKFRCVDCNEKYRRPPLKGKCTVCGGKIIFTISEGSIVKYLEPAKSLAKAYNLKPFLKQSIELLDEQIEEMFGRDKEKQLGLGEWF